MDTIEPIPTEFEDNISGDDLEAKFQSIERDRQYKCIIGNDLRYGYRFMKRTFDIVFSVCVLLVLLVPSIILCLIIMIESPGSPIYCQTRIGRHGKPFTMFKFRSMDKDADEYIDKLRGKNEADGPLFKIADDPRITKIGRFIRKHSIDELPQFINSLIGNMSVVGPRPALPQEVEYYDDYIRQRLLVKPGITGYWQTRDKNDLSFKDSVNLDLAYICEASILVDLNTVLITIPVAINGRNS